MTQRHKRGPTKRDKLEAELLAFNQWRKRQHERPLTIVEFTEYLHGKGLPEDRKVTLHAPRPKYEVPADRDPSRYPSVTSADPITGTRRDNRERIELSSHHPIAPAYNKGGYQVLLPSEIKTAGRKV